MENEVTNYAGTVLAAYAVSGLLLLLLVVQSLMAARRAKRDLEAFEKNG